jgi:metal transporter CNNM
MGVIYGTYHAISRTATESSGAASDATGPLDNIPGFYLIMMACGCLCLAATASGLTLGMFSLDTIGLEIIAYNETSRDAAAAKAILPVRAKGTLLLLTLIVSNTVATEGLPLILETLVPGGYFALIASIVLVITFGEIIPQAVCSRNALQIGQTMLPVIRVLRFIFFPIAAPIAAFLDWLLGEELGNVYSREELKGLIDVHTRFGLTQGESLILKGTLDFNVKTVTQVMTPARDVFMLDIDTKLDRNAMLEMLRRGHSRIPLFQGTRTNIVCLLLLKQLVLVDPADELPIRALINKKKRSHKIRVSPALHCSKNALLGDVLKEFQRGRSHMAIVYDDIAKPDGTRELLGIVTLEDLIEEIIQEEIVDETDVFVSNDSKRTVLIRGSDGKLRRSLNQSSVLKQLVPIRASALTTIIVKEIDVDELKRPLVANLTGETLRPDWKKLSGRSSLRSLPSDHGSPSVPAALSSGSAPQLAARSNASSASVMDDDIYPEESTELETEQLRLVGNRRLSLPTGYEEHSKLLPSVVNQYGTVMSLDISRFDALFEGDSDDEEANNATKQDLSANFETEQQARQDLT